MLKKRRNYNNRKEAAEMNSLALSQEASFSGEELETPHLVLMGFKSFYKEMYDTGDPLASQKTQSQKAASGMEQMW